MSRSREELKEYKKLYARKRREMPGARERDRQLGRTRYRKDIALSREKNQTKYQKSKTEILARLEDKRRAKGVKKKTRMPEWYYRIKNALYLRAYLTIKKGYKSDRTSELIGCSHEAFLEHIESKFTDGMSFQNYGKWHIDHIRPCRSFDLIKEDEQRKCFNYTNLQPLWAVDNLRKGGKIG